MGDNRDLYETRTKISFIVQEVPAKVTMLQVIALFVVDALLLYMVICWIK